MRLTDDEFKAFWDRRMADRRMADRRDWTIEAVKRIEADINRSSDTHLLRHEVEGLPGIVFYFKDESTHPTGSLKHRLARSLFLFAICNGWITEGTAVVEASSGSTAVSEAYFAKLLGLPFHAVMPDETSSEKIAAIEFYGGQCHFVGDPMEIYVASRRLAEELGGHYLDQFTFAERATDWRGNNNIAESIFHQMAQEPHPVPEWIIMGAGTGGTSATIGRYIRFRHFDTRLCVVDTTNSVFYDNYTQGCRDLTIAKGSLIEGIGRPRVEPSFIPGVVDRMIKVPDAASLAAMHVLAKRLGRCPGGSTGTNFYGMCQIAAEMRARHTGGSLVTLICDAGERYRQTYFNDAWLAAQRLDIAPYAEQLTHFLACGEWCRPAL